MKAIQPEILFEDEHLLVLNKPPELLTLPDRFDATLPNLRTMMKERYGDIFIVHRLDKQTSGAILFAKDSDTHKNLNTQFQSREVRKIYHAIIAGVLDRDDMEIDIPIEPDPVRKGLMRPSVHGKASLTLVRVKQRFRMATLLECLLVTGRTHQIRVHCATIGHPLLVDPDYGGTNGFMLSTIKRKFNLAKDTDERPLIARLTLHSHSLEFTHPVSGERIKLEAAYPKDFSATLRVLEKYASTPSVARF